MNNFSGIDPGILGSLRAQMGGGYRPPSPLLGNPLPGLTRPPAWGSPPPGIMQPPSHNGGWDISEPMPNQPDHSMYPHPDFGGGGGHNGMMRPHFQPQSMPGDSGPGVTPGMPGAEPQPDAAPHQGFLQALQALRQSFPHLGNAPIHRGQPLGFKKLLNVHQAMQQAQQYGSQIQHKRRANGPY